MSVTDKVRAAFEAWRRSTTKMDPDSAVALDGFTDGYANKITRVMHPAFSAGYEQGRLAGLEAAAAVCDRRGEEHHELARQDDKSVYHDDRGGACLDCADAIRSLATKKGDHLVDANKMIQERDELEKDATRYRAFFDGGMSVCFCGEVFYTKAECDAAIDAALAKQQEVHRLKDAIEGECDGLAITDDHARAILTYVYGGK